MLLDSFFADGLLRYSFFAHKRGKILCYMVKTIMQSYNGLATQEYDQGVKQ